MLIESKGWKKVADKDLFRKNQGKLKLRGDRPSDDHWTVAKKILLGANTNILGNQIDSLSSLLNQLPIKVKDQIKSIDLTNPSQPELKLTNQ